MERSKRKIRVGLLSGMSMSGLGLSMSSMSLSALMAPGVQKRIQNNVRGLDRHGMPRKKKKGSRLETR